jgi:hypothetical protein
MSRTTSRASVLALLATLLAGAGPFAAHARAAEARVEGDTVASWPRPVR